MIKYIFDFIYKLIFNTKNLDQQTSPFEIEPEEKEIMLSEYLSLRRAVKSNTAIKLGFKNKPNEEQIENLKEFGIGIYDKLIRKFGNVVNSTSIFRSPKLNRKVKGSRTSQHKKGEAGDFDQDIMTTATTNAEIFYYIKDNLIFDQLIWEHGSNQEPAWIHVSKTKNKNRKQVLRAYSKKNVFGKWKTKYRLWRTSND